MIKECSCLLLSQNRNQSDWKHTLQLDGFGASENAETPLKGTLNGALNPKSRWQKAAAVDLLSLDEDDVSGPSTDKILESRVGGGLVHIHTYIQTYRQTHNAYIYIYT